MNAPPYFHQSHPAACSLACLRMALAWNGMSITEVELLSEVQPDYGIDFSAIWNPTIAKLACRHGLAVHIEADWLLLQPETIQKAVLEYRENPQTFDPSVYERVKDLSGQPLSLAYSNMFEAISLGCQTGYGRLTEPKLRQWLEGGALVQTTVILERFRPGKTGLHSILIYDINGPDALYHNPDEGQALRHPIADILAAQDEVGAYLAYRRRI